MKVFDTVDLKIEKIGDSVGILLPMEYEALEGLDAKFSAGVEGDELVLQIKPSLNCTVKDTVDELWRDLRILFSKIGDIGETPWNELEVVWNARHVYEEKVPVSASEVLNHRHIRAVYGEEYIVSEKEDMRKSIHDTITKLGELAALRLGFKDELFARAFGQAVGNNFSCNIASLYGMSDIVFEIFNEEFIKVDDDHYWKLTSETAQNAVKAAYKRIMYLSEHPKEYEKEKARVEKKWGIWVNPA